MNNHLKGILVGAFILLIALLLLSKCHSCGHPREIAQLQPDTIPPVVSAAEPGPEGAVCDADA